MRVIPLAFLFFISSCAYLWSGNIEELKNHPSLSKSCSQYPIKENANLNPENKDMVIIIHGLNNNEFSLNGMIEIANELSLQPVPVLLSGHRGIKDEIEKVSRPLWQSEIHRTYCDIKNHTSKSKKLYLFANSLGALATVDTIINSQREKMKFEKSIFFAPAFSPHGFTYAVQMFFLFGDSFRLPSMTPKDYRSNDGTSMAAYRALLQNVEKIKTQTWPSHLVNSQTITFLDPDDELVSLEKLEKLYANKKLTNWKIIRVNNENSKLDKPYHHLIIDNESVGQKQWSEIKSQVKSFLEKNDG